MNRNVVLEAFGSITNENARNDDVDLIDVAVAGLEEIDALVGLDNIGTIFTGMGPEFTNCLEEIEEHNDEFDIDVQPFYPNISNIMEEDDVDYNTAWKRGFQWRNGILFDRDPDDDQYTVDLAVRLGDSASSGVPMLKRARRKGVTGIDINLDRLVDRDVAYGGEPEDELDAETEELVEDMEAATAQ